jgi:hypothetical protein
MELLMFKHFAAATLPIMISACAATPPAEDAANPQCKMVRQDDDTTSHIQVKQVCEPASPTS